jgi:hypothetical protein
MAHRTNTLRVIPMFQPASVLARVQHPTQHPAPPVMVRPAAHAYHVPDASELAQAVLQNAQAGLREPVRVHDFARREIGQANRGIFCNHIIKNITAERRRALRSAAFLPLNKCRDQLSQAGRRVAAA